MLSVEDLVKALGEVRATTMAAPGLHCHCCPWCQSGLSVPAWFACCHNVSALGKTAGAVCTRCSTRPASACPPVCSTA